MRSGQGTGQTGKDRGSPGKPGKGPVRMERPDQGDAALAWPQTRLAPAPGGWDIPAPTMAKLRAPRTASACRRIAVRAVLATCLACPWPPASLGSPFPARSYTLMRSVAAGLPSSPDRSSRRFFIPVDLRPHAHCRDPLNKKRMVLMSIVEGNATIESIFSGYKFVPREDLKFSGYRFINRHGHVDE